MKLLTIDGYGYNLSVDGGRLEATNGHHINRKKQTTKYRKNYLDFDKVVISGNHGNLSVSAIRWIMKQKRDIVILDWNGRIITSMSPVLANRGQHKIAQYDVFNNPEKKSKIARWIIEQKIKGSISVLDWLSEKKGFSCDKILYKLSQDISKSDNLTKTLRIEAGFSYHYWRALGSLFDKKWEFVSRNFGDSWSSQEADDPINAMFNYGYSILESECWKAVNTVGLEPYIGFIHKTYTNKAPLIYDLQEPFRWLIEIGVLKLILGNKIKKSDFINTDNGNVRLRPTATKMLLEGIAEQFSMETKHIGIKRQWGSMIMIKAREMTRLF